MRASLWRALSGAIKVKCEGSDCQVKEKKRKKEKKAKRNEKITRGGILIFFLPLSLSLSLSLSPSFFLKYVKGFPVKRREECKLGVTDRKIEEKEERRKKERKKST